jgi:hypothetical protein
MTRYDRFCRLVEYFTYPLVMGSTFGLGSAVFAESLCVPEDCIPEDFEAAAIEFFAWALTKYHPEARPTWLDESYRPIAHCDRETIRRSAMARAESVMSRRGGADLVDALRVALESLAERGRPFNH